MLKDPTSNKESSLNCARKELGSITSDFTNQKRTRKATHLKGTNLVLFKNTMKRIISFLVKLPKRLSFLEKESRSSVVAKRMIPESILFHIPPGSL
jgi:hypothetical protein